MKLTIQPDIHFKVQADGSYFATGVGSLFSSFEAREGTGLLTLTIKKNLSPVPVDYTFLIDVFIDSVRKGVLSIRPSDTGDVSQTFSTTISNSPTTGNLHRLELKWSNDLFQAGKYDANLCVASVHFESSEIPAIVSASRVVSERENVINQLPSGTQNFTPPNVATITGPAGPNAVQTQTVQPVDAVPVKDKIAGIVSAVPDWVKLAVGVAVLVWAYIYFVKKK